MVLVIGAAQTPFNRRRDGSSFRDWACDAFDAALAMSGIGRADIDALIVASESDFFTLQLNPASVLAQDLGLTGAETLRVEGGGATGQLAVHAGAERILSARARHVAVVGVDPSASALSGDSIRELYGYSFDFWTDGLSGVTATSLYALSWQAFAADLGGTEADLNAVTLKNRGNATLNPNAHLPRHHRPEDFEAAPMIAAPYRRLHCSPLSDGAAALILADAATATARNMLVLAKIVSTGLGGVRPEVMGLGPVPAVTEALSRAGLTIADIACIESNEAFAAQACAVARELNFPPEITNPNGGAIALGHPVGASGAIILTKLIHELRRTGGRFGLATMCIGGGQGIALAVERLWSGQGDPLRRSATVGGIAHPTN